MFKEYTRSGMILRVLLSALFGLLFWVSPQVLATEQDDPAECLLISDIHFNPFLDPGLFAAAGEPSRFGMGAAS